MQRRCLLVFLILVCFSTAGRANTLYLPRQFSPSEMTTVGVAFVNPTLTAASLTFRLGAVDGTTIASATATIAAKSQSALTLGQIFPNVNSSGWFSADADVDQVTGFWMSGDFVNSTDGARLLSSNDASATPAFCFFTAASEISFVNAGSIPVSGRLMLVNSGGTTVTTVPFQVPTLGVYQQSVSSVFPAQAADFNTNGYWISVSSADSTAKIVGTTMTPGIAENTASNAIASSAAQGVFPHVVAGAAGGTNYDTILTLTNYRSASTMTLTLHQSSGAVLTAHPTIAQYGVFRSSVTSLFGVSPIDGWIQVDAGSGFVAGFVIYTDTQSGGTTAVEMQASSSSDASLIFGHIADLSPWWSGIALANPSTTDAQVEVYAFDLAGHLVSGPQQSANAAFTLTANTKKAFLLDQVLPALQARASDGGYIFVRTTNAVQINGVELFFLRNGRVYSNVPATRLTRFGIAFTPPSDAYASSTGTIAVEQAFLGDANNNSITSFQPGSTVTFNIQINNTTGRAIPVTRQYRVVGPGGYVLYMGSVAGDQPTGSTLRYINVTVPSDAPAGTYTATGSVDYNGTITTSSSVTLIPGSCTPSDTKICVPATDYNGIQGQDSSGACFDTNGNKSSVGAIKLIAQGGTPFSNYTWSLSHLNTFPPGITVEPLTGILKGNGGLVLPGNYVFSMDVSDGVRMGSGQISVQVILVNSDFLNPNNSNVGFCPMPSFQQPHVTPIVLPAAKSGKGYGADLEVLGIPTGGLTWTVSSGSIPPGMLVDLTNGVLRGTPFSSAAGQTYRFHVTVTTSNTSADPRVAVYSPEYVITVQ